MNNSPGISKKRHFRKREAVGICSLGLDICFDWAKIDFLHRKKRLDGSKTLFLCPVLSKQETKLSWKTSNVKQMGVQNKGKPSAQVQQSDRYSDSCWSQVFVHYLGLRTVARQTRCCGHWEFQSQISSPMP